MCYGFYAGELAIQKMLINSFPEQLGGKDPFDPGFFITGLDYVHRVKKRRDIGVHIAFPGTIYSPGLEEENKVKPKVTLKVEETDGGASPEVVAKTIVDGTFCLHTKW